MRQGYYFSPPVTTDAFSEWLVNKMTWYCKAQ